MPPSRPRCARGPRPPWSGDDAPPESGRRPDVAAFLLDLETEAFALCRELLAGTWRPGPYRTFTRADPMSRLISATPFRDRVVHHALTRVLEPHFEPRFSRDSCACRRGYGTHRALDRARAACRRFPYVLKGDIVRYFPSSRVVLAGRPWMSLVHLGVVGPGPLWLGGGL